jgi:hypothetical protein
MGNTTFTPKVRLDLMTASNEAFATTVKSFHDEMAREHRSTRPAMPFDKSGWHRITPEMAEAALARSAGNREVVLGQVRSYALDMTADDWKKTGEAIVFNERGELNDGQHRLWACYLSGQSFDCYVVVDAPVVENLFAYYDSGKNRSAADALHTAGLNGLGRVHANAIQLLIRYENNTLGPIKSIRFRKINTREVLAFAQKHPDYLHAVDRMFGKFPETVRVIGDKGAAAAFAWLITRSYDDGVVDHFLRALGSGAMLNEDDPILALRTALMIPAEDPAIKLKPRTRLALLTKAFMMSVAGQAMNRTRGGKILGLAINHSERLTKVEPPATAAA